MSETGPLVFALLLAAALIGCMAYAIASSPIGNREDEAAKAENEGFEARMRNLSAAIAEAATETAIARGRIEQSLGIPVYQIDQRQNAPTSLTIQ